MKRWARGVIVLLSLAAFCWFVRAVYLYRVWQIAAIWYPATPAPRFAPCLFGNVSATTLHGAFADAVFLRVPLSPEEARSEPLRQSLAASTTGSESLTVPLVADNSLTPCGTDWTRNEPPRIPAAFWADCYGVAGWFPVATVKRGAAIVRNEPTPPNAVNNAGGMVLLDANRATLYIAAYRTR